MLGVLILSFCFCSGLQTSPSKHGGYSVRMDNTVPLVTQTAGAQALQIQQGLLTQVGVLRFLKAIAKSWEEGKKAVMRSISIYFVKSKMMRIGCYRVVKQ